MLNNGVSKGIGAPTEDTNFKYPRNARFFSIETSKVNETNTKNNTSIPSNYSILRNSKDSQISFIR